MPRMSPIWEFRDLCAERTYLIAIVCKKKCQLCCLTWCPAHSRCRRWGYISAWPINPSSTDTFKANPFPSASTCYCLRRSTTWARKMHPARRTIRQSPKYDLVFVAQGYRGKNPLKRCGDARLFAEAPIAFLFLNFFSKRRSSERFFGTVVGAGMTRRRP